VEIRAPAETPTEVIAAAGERHTREVDFATNRPGHLDAPDIGLCRRNRRGCCNVRLWFDTGQGRSILLITISQKGVRDPRRLGSSQPSEAHRW
jgi:hypothetical protein